MIERIITSEGVSPPEQENTVFNSTLLLNGEPAGPKIVERILDYPDIKRIVIFGEPGANKTTILLQMMSEITRLDPNIEPNYVFYDNALARIKAARGFSSLTTRPQFDEVSNELSREMNQSFPKESVEGKRLLQVVELVGVGRKNRGTSSLIEAAERAHGQNPMTQDTLVIGVAADERSLRDAGEVRRAVSELADPLEVFDLLKKFNIQLSGYPKDIPLADAAREIVEFYKRMASADRIKKVHSEVRSQAKQASTEDEERLFTTLRLPSLPYPIETIEVRKVYLLNAAFMQAFLQRLGLKPDMYDTSFKMEDTGLVVFSPYNPSIPKVMDLSKALL